MTEVSIHWADKIVDELLAKHGNAPYLISSGISPSGRIHVGNAREILTADIIYRILLERNVPANLIFIADDYDALRKVYPFLDPIVYEKYVGCPLSEIPAPDGSDQTYSEYFLLPFLDSLKELKVNAKIIRASELYRDGIMKEQIIKALENRDVIAEILNRVTGKEIEDNWSPFNPHCRDCGSMTAAEFISWDKTAETFEYDCKRCGSHKTVPLVGNGKLTWRVDWPAKWAVFNVSVEPFGKDHGGKGGSYDTGIEISEKVFGKQAPFPVIYEWIRLKGLGDMSSSKGNVVAIDEVLEVVPPDVLRYFITRPAPKASLALDLTTQLLNLVDEVDDETKKQRDIRAIELSRSGGFEPIGIPFNHLINVYQVAQGDLEKVKSILKRTGYKWSNDSALEKRCQYAKCWLERFATDDYKFQLLTEKNLSLNIPQNIIELLKNIAKQLKVNSDKDGDSIHKIIYDTANAAGVNLGDVCKAIYQILIGKDRGPRAGWFISLVGPIIVAEKIENSI